MIALEYDEIQQDPALQHIEDYFKANPELLNLPDLLDGSFSKQEFEEFELLLS